MRNGKLWFWLRRGQLDAELAEEMALHVEERAAELEQEGVPHSEALRRARVEFGSSTRMAERTRAEWQLGWVTDLVSDLRYALRAMRRNPGFVAASTLSLALGIGMNTTIFSLTAEFLFSEPSVTKPETLVRATLGRNSHQDQKNFRFLRDANAFPGLAGLREDSEVNWRNGDETRRLFAMRATGNYFAVTGVPMQFGRGLADAELDTVVVSDQFWRNSLRQDPGILGRSLLLDGKPFTVVGVLPPDHRTLFGFGLSPDFYLPLLDERTAVRLYLRIPEGISLDAARERLTLLAKELDKALPASGGGMQWSSSVVVVPVAGLGQLADDGLQRSVAPFFAILMAVGGLLLCIACINVSGLLLARASSRTQEFAIRLSLGSGRGRLMRQMLTESLLLAVLGTLAGLALNLALTQFLNRIEPSLPIPVRLHIEPDWRLLAYASGIALLCALLVGVLPAWRGSRADVNNALKANEHQTGGRLTLRRLLVVGQVAASIVVLTAAALFGRNLLESVTMRPGFDLDKTLFASVRLAAGEKQDEAAVARRKVLAERMQRELEAIPGVQSAAITLMVPFNDDQTRGGEIRSDVSNEVRSLPHHLNSVGPGYFGTLGIPIVAGRDFASADADSKESPVIVNETFARGLFGNMPAVGHTWFSSNRSRLVIGVVRDSKYFWFGENGRAAVFEAFRPAVNSSRSANLNFMVRSAVDPESLVRPLTLALQRMEPTAAVESKPMKRATGIALLPSQVGAGLLGAAGVLGLVLTAVGLYGLLAYSVSRRTREIGLRMALGAEPGRILSLVFREGGWLLAIGMLLGIAAALFVTKPLAQFLVPGLSTEDPATYVVVAGLLLVIGWLATLIPARRALRIAPMEALRHE